MRIDNTMNITSNIDKLLISIKKKYNTITAYLNENSFVLIYKYLKKIIW